MKTYGKVRRDAENNTWVIDACEPHVSIKLKAVFNKISKSSIPPYAFPDNPETAADLKWFLSRYPLAISIKDKNFLAKGEKAYADRINRFEKLLLPSYKPRLIELKKPYKARKYQSSFADLFYEIKKTINGDEFGLGKTLIGILPMLKPGTLPAIVVCETNLQKQWIEEGIYRFTNLTAHPIKGTKPYDLPPADVYVIKYSCVSGWVNVLTTGVFKYAVFDECQNLRNTDSDRYRASKRVCDAVEYCLFLSATPIFGYGSEIFNVLNCLKDGCLGGYGDFSREWCGWGKAVTDAKALGSYLREQYLFFKRSREDVGMELPIINTIVHTVDYDEDAVHSQEALLKQIASSVLTGSFHERGEAARELDMRLRQLTGVSKARPAAAFIKLLIDNGESVLVAAWHREVYEILNEELAAYKPVMYTGSESPKQKHEAKLAFTSGETKCMLMSLRSGAGLDGLQYCCRYVVFAELDFSKKPMEQLIARVDRPGSTEQVTAIYLVSEWGSDPSIIDLLGLKESQFEGIVNPLVATQAQFTDEGRIKTMAKRFLEQ